MFYKLELFDVMGKLEVSSTESVEGELQIALEMLHLDQTDENRVWCFRESPYPAQNTNTSICLPIPTWAPEHLLYLGIVTY
jgi:hypothetical protein